MAGPIWMIKVPLWHRKNLGSIGRRFSPSTQKRNRRTDRRTGQTGLRQYRMSRLKRRHRPTGGIWVSETTKSHEDVLFAEENFNLLAIAVPILLGSRWRLSGRRLLVDDIPSCSRNVSPAAMRLKPKLDLIFKLSYIGVWRWGHTSANW